MKKAKRYVERALHDIVALGQHEADVLTGHWSEVGERMAVARRARDVVELLSDQIDLLPETRERVRRNGQRRRAMLRDLVADLAGRRLAA
jgi:hypothetical protein